MWTLSQDDSHIHYCIHASSERTGDQEHLKQTPKQKRIRTSYKVNNCQEKSDAALKDYFQLQFSLKKLYSEWKTADSNFARVCSKFPGVRILYQDPVENVFSFICSSNNNIQRYEGMG